MAVKFYLDARANKHNEYPIRASFSIKSQKLVTSIGISVSEEVWNNGKVRSKKYTNSKGITGLEINSTIIKIENHFTQYELELDGKHSDYKSMRPYIEIAEKTKADAMKLIENAWGM